MKSLANNVHTLPVNTDRPTHDPLEMMRRVTDMKLLAVEDAIEFLAPPMFEALQAAGFQTGCEVRANLLVGVMRSIMYQHFGLSSPLDAFINDHIMELAQVLHLDIDVVDDD